MKDTLIGNNLQDLYEEFYAQKRNNQSNYSFINWKPNRIMNDNEVNMLSFEKMKVVNYRMCTIKSL